ncbi:allene oxide cyclase barrel-like domain-containing protein [Streptomyces sp. NPDC055815]
MRAACLGAATLVTLLTCTSVAADAATDTDSAQAGSKARTITLRAEVKELTRIPATGDPAQGDRAIARSDLSLFDDPTHAKIGESHVACTTTRGGDDEAEQCVATYVLPDGQLTVQGMYFNYLDQGPFDNAITGGTGRYDKARGSVHSEPAGPRVRTFTINLV